MSIGKMYKVKKEKERRVNDTDEERDREKGCKSEWILNREKRERESKCKKKYGNAKMVKSHKKKERRVSDTDEEREREKGRKSECTGNISKRCKNGVNIQKEKREKK